MDHGIARERQQRLTSIKQELASVRGDAARLLWRYGALLAEVERDELWREDGQPSFFDWAESELDLGRNQARKAITIARHFTAEMAERFGSEKLAATVRYLEVTARDEQPGDVQALEFRVRGEGGRWVRVPFVDASYRQILEAAEHVRASQRSRTLGAPEPHVREQALALAKALPVAPKGTVRGERVAVKTGKDGRLAVTVQGIPLDELEAVLVALREHLGAREGVG